MAKKKIIINKEVEKYLKIAKLQEEIDNIYDNSEMFKVGDRVIFVPYSIGDVENNLHYIFTILSIKAFNNKPIFNLLYEGGYPYYEKQAELEQLFNEYKIEDAKKFYNSKLKETIEFICNNLLKTEVDRINFISNDDLVNGFSIDMDIRTEIVSIFIKSKNPIDQIYENYHLNYAYY